MYNTVFWWILHGYKYYGFTYILKILLFKNFMAICDTVYIYILVVCNNFDVTNMILRSDSKLNVTK